MTLEFIPIAQISDFYKQGWRFAQDLKRDDYAALMEAPAAPAISKNNKVRAYTSREEARANRKLAEAR